MSNGSHWRQASLGALAFVVLVAPTAMPAEKQRVAGTTASVSTRVFVRVRDTLDSDPGRPAGPRSPDTAWAKALALFGEAPTPGARPLRPAAGAKNASQLYGTVIETAEGTQVTLYRVVWPE